MQQVLIFTTAGISSCSSKWCPSSLQLKAYADNNAGGQDAAGDDMDIVYIDDLKIEVVDVHDVRESR